MGAFWDPSLRDHTELLVRIMAKTRADGGLRLVAVHAIAADNKKHPRIYAECCVSLSYI